MLNENRLNNMRDKDVEPFVLQNKDLIKKPVVSVTQNDCAIKKISGANNFTSLAVYWHPDPASPTGYPYIRKDGFRNPEASISSDNRFLSELINSVISATLIYKLTKSDEYCKKAVEMMRFFFLSESTRMNPNMTYSGIVMGDSESNPKVRGAIIDSNRLPMIVDMISVLRESRNWTQKDDDGMKSWFGEMANWFQASPRGVIQSGYYHNIKTSYMTQLASYLVAAGRKDEAKAYINSNVKEVLSKQIDSDGQQTLELDRVTKRHYCSFNLILLCNLAKVCSSLGMDIWDYADEKGRGSIRQAMKYMSEIYLDQSKWTLTEERNNSASTRAWVESGCSIYGDEVMIEAFREVKIYNFISVVDHVFVPDRK